MNHLKKTGLGLLLASCLLTSGAFAEEVGSEVSPVVSEESIDVPALETDTTAVAGESRGSAETAETLASEEPVSAQLEEGEPAALSVEELKKKVIELNRDLFILEEDLLFPANTQFVVFLSIDTGQFMDLDVVKLKVNDQIVATHLYTERQLEALSRGGIQRLYVGNLKTGEHEVTAFLEGIGPDERVYKKAASSVISKDTDIKSIEIRIADKSQDFQPHISIEEWE